MKLLRLLIPVLILFALVLWFYTDISLDGFARGGGKGIAPPSEKEMQQTFAMRLAAGDTLPLPDSVLMAFLPGGIKGFSSEESKGSTFRGKRTAFSQVRRMYLSEGQSFISIQISDYLADSSGFSQHWQQYRRYSKKPGFKALVSRKSHPEVSNLFVWNRESQQGTNLRVLEAGACYRFHIVIRGGNTFQLRTAFEALDWAALSDYCLKPDMHFQTSLN